MIGSVGTLYGIQDLFDHLNAHRVQRDEFLSGFDKYGPSTADDVYNTATALSWICTSADGQLVPTVAGTAALCGKTRSERLRHQLANLVECQKPTWAALLPKGRKEAVAGMPVEIKQCFEEALLFSEVDDEIVKWWDRLAGVMREFAQRKQIETGRIGERLTFHYESERTLKKPIWQAVETNYAGYDVLSVVAKNDDTALRIEVKASERGFKYAEIHITEHEWITATKPTGPYCFYVWLLDVQPQLFIVPSSVVAAHIPANQGKGRWKSSYIRLGALTHPSKAVKHGLSPIS